LRRIRTLVVCVGVITGGSYDGYYTTQPTKRREEEEIF
jgi:hypothetical protein